MAANRKFQPIVLALAVWMVLPAGISYSEGDSPRLQITVRDATGQRMAVADRVRMTDASDFGSGSVRSPRTDDFGNVFFGPRDFEGFIVSGVNRNGEEQTKPYDGRGGLGEGYFNVKLTLDIDGYPTREQTVQVPVAEPMNYDFSMGNY